MEETEVQRTNSCNIAWTSSSFSPRVHEFNSPHAGIKAGLSSSARIIDYFQLFFSEELAHLVAGKMNSYRCEKNNNNADSPVQKETTASELYRFFAVSLLMTRNKKLSLHEYWSKDKLLRSDVFGEIMSRNRYFFILQMLHFSDEPEDGGDRLKKIRAVIDTLRKAFNDAFQPFQRLYIDESLLLYKGRTSFRQYAPSKKNGFGVKSFVLCDCETGYIQDIIIYTGSSSVANTEYKHMGRSGALALTLLKPYLGRGHTVFVDSWCASPTLFNLLHKNATNACGTVVKKRKGMPKMDERLQKGEASFRSSDNLLAIKWADKREVYMLSTIHLPQFAEVTKHHGKGETIRKPVCVIDYNASMRAVDKADTMISTAEATCKNLKSHRKYFFHLLDMCVWNAYCLYKHRAKKTVSLARFQLQLIKEMLEKYNANPAHHNSKAGSNAPQRLTQRHFPSVYESLGKNRNRRCVVCSKNDKRRETKYQCEDCDVGLCVTPCFKIYHTELYY